MNQHILIVPKGAEYITKEGKRIKEGNPIPAPQHGDKLKTDDYIFRYGSQIKETSNGKMQFARMQKYGWTFSVNPDAKLNKSFSNIPWIIGGQPVTNMDFAFHGCVNMITSPEIPSTVNSMKCAYNECASLEVLPVLPSYVENLERTFYGCKSLKTYNGSKEEDFNFKNYIIPLYAKTISGCFEYCQSMKNVPNLKLLSNLIHAERAFANCKSIETIKDFVVPVRTYVDSMFENCPNIKFERSKHITPSTSKKLTKPITEKSEIAPKILGIPETKGVFIRNGKTIKKIEKFPKEFELGDEFHVGNYVYKYNAKFVESEGVISWRRADEQNGWGVFYAGKRNATNVETIKETVLGVPVVNADYTFANLELLESAPPMPDTIVSMEGTYKNCKSLKKMPVLSNVVKNLKSTFENCISMNGFEEPNKTMRMMWRDVKMTPIPYSAKSIDYMFKGCSSLKELPQISHLDNINSIEGTFENCNGIVDLREYSLPRVGNMERTFYRCSNLKYPPETINASRMRLTFGKCENLLVTPQIGSSVQDMTGAFAYCKNLKKPTNRLAKISDKAFYMCPKLKELPKSVGSVQRAESAFEGCANLEKICDLASFEKLENAKKMFKDCVKAKTKETMILPRTLENIDEMMLNCESMHNTMILTSHPEGRDTAFKNTGISVELGHVQLDKLKPSEKIPRGMTYYSADGNIVAKEGDAYPKIQDGDKAIMGSYQYIYNKELNGWSVSVLEQSKVKERIENVQEIINNCAIVDISKAFRGCKKMITPPKLPETIMMADEAFKDCTSLRLLPVLPKKVFTANEAFSGCISAYTYFGAIAINQQGNFSDYKLPSRIESANNIFKGCQLMIYKPDIDNCTKLKNRDNLFGDTKTRTENYVIDKEVQNHDDLEL